MCTARRSASTDCDTSSSPTSITSYLNADPVQGLPTIDRLAPSTRPRPLDVPLFTAVDDLNSWNIARVGMRNTLQTKRDGTAYNWMGLNTYADIFFKDPEFDRNVSNLYNDFFWRPLHGCSSPQVQTPLGSSAFNYTEINTALAWMPVKNFSWTVGHAYIKNNPIFVDSSLFNSRLYARLSENWGVSMNHIYEATDHTLEYQSYSIHRDLSSWILSLGGLIRKNGAAGANDFGIVLTLTLKDFPQVSIPFDLPQLPFSLFPLFSSPPPPPSFRHHPPFSPKKKDGPFLPFGGGNSPLFSLKIRFFYSNFMKLTIIGSGYVGLVTGACFADVGHNVICVDNDQRKVDALQAGKIPIYEPGLENSCIATSARNASSSPHSTEEGVDHGEVIFIAVPTPPQPDGSVDLSFIEKVARGNRRLPRQLPCHRGQEHRAREDRRTRDANHPPLRETGRRVRRGQQSRNSSAKAAPWPI